MGKFYRLMFDQRQQGDYEDIAEFEPAELTAWLAEARVFVAQIKAWIEEHKGMDIVDYDEKTNLVESVIRTGPSGIVV